MGFTDSQTDSIILARKLFCFLRVFSLSPQENHFCMLQSKMLHKNLRRVFPAKA
jgi:hypothetical protein